MSNPKLHIAFGEYGRTRVLADGTVKMEGVEVDFYSNRIVTEVFEGMVRGKYDVSELGLSHFLRTMDFDDPPFLAIPVFPNRCFRHSAIYVNVNSGIKKPEDLVSKRVGEFALYGHDAGVWPKGILSDDYRVKPEQCSWVIGGLDWPLKPTTFVPQPHPANVQVTNMPNGTDLGQLLEDGEIDALISADIPKCILEKSPKVALLFPDYVATERAYYQRTGIYPIMHTVVVRKELALQQPDLIRAVYQGFCDAENLVKQQYTQSIIFQQHE
ncbi:hypothetical protein [Hymenobacter coccineus]|uniref:hypothetical protein n=1 Tax=Hymenobacter coccineus TaxID=1908235 RepID=UPI001955ECEE|nr:hypothetical protein [Hymenobacter coccineus]